MEFMQWLQTFDQPQLEEIRTIVQSMISSKRAQLLREIFPGTLVQFENDKGHLEQGVVSKVFRVSVLVSLGNNDERRVQADKIISIGTEQAPGGYDLDDSTHIDSVVTYAAREQPFVLED
jgi:hypothetical protein